MIPKLLFCAFMIIVVKGQFLNEPCTILESGKPGECELFEDCLEVLEAHVMSNKRPQICSIISGKRIVCCPKAKEKKKRISAQKCEEYGSNFVQQVVVSSLALFSVPKVINRTIDCVSSKSLIVGGKPAKPKEFPHMAAIGWRSASNSIDFSCGGVLISERFVLTAAHCLSKRKVAPIVVRLGDLDLESDNDIADPQEFGIESLIKHPEYKRSEAYNDIGLIKLDKDARFNSFVRPACLWQEDEDVGDISPIATGWGDLQYYGPKSNELQKVSLNILSNERCDSLYAPIIKTSKSLAKGIVDSQLCATVIEDGELVGGRDTCRGDSGGPLQYKINDDFCLYHVLAITSAAASGCGFANSAGIYTRVSSYLEFIESNVW